MHRSASGVTARRMRTTRISRCGPRRWKMNGAATSCPWKSAMSDRLERCDRCRFWWRCEGSDEGDGTCRRHAPMSLGQIDTDASPDSRYHCFWPLTQGGDGCGDFQPLPVAQCYADLPALSPEETQARCRAAIETLTGQGLSVRAAKIVVYEA